MRWVLIALLGLAVAAVVSLSASDLTSQPVGLSSEPLTAGDQLAPRTKTVTRTITTKARTTRTTPARTTPTTTSTATAPPAVVTTDDHGGRGRGRGSDDGSGGGDGDD